MASKLLVRLIVWQLGKSIAKNCPASPTVQMIAAVHAVAVVLPSTTTVYYSNMLTLEKSLSIANCQLSILSAFLFELIDPQHNNSNQCTQNRHVQGETLYAYRLLYQ